MRNYTNRILKTYTDKRMIVLGELTHSDWAAPIVPVSKANSKYVETTKVTINHALDVDQYPLLKPDDLFATLAGRKEFTKLNLTQAYQ